MRGNSGPTPVARGWSIRGGSGLTPVARGGSEAKTPPLAARVTLTPYHRRACGCKAGIQLGVFEGTVF